MLEVESSDTIYNVKAKCQIRDYHCLGVFSSLFYHKFTTQFMSRCLSNSFYCTFTTQFISRCLLQLVLLHIHCTSHMSVSSPVCSITHSPVNSSLGVFCRSFYHKFTTQFISQCLLQLVLLHIHHTSHILVNQLCWSQIGTRRFQFRVTHVHVSYTITTTFCPVGLLHRY